jgi:hypothetical protein
MQMQYFRMRTWHLFLSPAHYDVNMEALLWGLTPWMMLCSGPIAVSISLCLLGTNTACETCSYGKDVCSTTQQVLGSEAESYSALIPSLYQRKKLARLGLWISCFCREAKYSISA